LNLPEPTCLPNTNNSPQPYVIIGDEAFGLHRNLLRPYPGREDLQLNEKYLTTAYPELEDTLNVRLVYWQTN